MNDSPVIKLQTMAEDLSTEMETLLMRAKIIAVKLGQESTTEWINNELNGYPNNQLLPDYRVLKNSRIVALNPPVGWIPFDLLNVGEKSRDIYEVLTTVYVTNTMSTIVEYSNFENPIYAEMPSDLAGFLQEIEKIDFRLAWKLNTLQMKTIITNVRAKVLDWSLELEANGILGEKLLFSSKEKERSYNVTINDNRSVNSINVGRDFNSTNSIFELGNSGASHLSVLIKEGDFNSLERHLKEHEIQDSDINDLKNIIDKIQPPKNKSQIESSFGGWISKMIEKAGSGTIKIASAAAPVLLVNYLCHYYGIPV